MSQHANHLINNPILGICLALSTATELKDIKAWTKYPGGSSHQGAHYEKVPSVIAFASENADLTETAWGYQVEPGMKSYTCFKLLLDRAAIPTEYDDPQLQASTAEAITMLPPGMTAKDITTEYLRGLHAMFQEAVVSFLGERILNDMPTEFWLTVPATWTEKAKVLTKQAALDAGFGQRAIDRILLIPEPEAGAHLALRDSLHKVGDLVEVRYTGQSHVPLLDKVDSDSAGREWHTSMRLWRWHGGSYSCLLLLLRACLTPRQDITTYEVQHTSPTLITEEICVGIGKADPSTAFLLSQLMLPGGKCGGTYVDRNLHALMRTRFGAAFTSLPIHERGPGSHFMDTFEHKKRDFDVTNPSTRPIKIHLPMDNVPAGMEQYYDKRNYVLLSHTDMTSLFEPVVDMVIRLVEDQIRLVDKVRREKRLKTAAIDTVVLIGGFGSSPYLRHRIEDRCAQSEIRVITPWNGA